MLLLLLLLNMTMMMQHPSCLSLMVMAYNNDDNKVNIAAAGGIERIITAIHEHKDEIGVASGACGVNGSIALP